MNYLLFTVNIVNKIKLGFGDDDVDVNKHIAKTTVPVLIFNSKNDTLTPYFMGEDIYKFTTHDKKKIVTVNDSEHANIWLDYNDKYKKKVLKFINSK